MLASRLKDKPVIKNHHCVSEICRPLFQKTPIDFLEFIRSYKDGSYITYCTKPEWIEHYFKEKLYEKTCFHANYSSYKKSYILTESLKNSADIVKQGSQLYNIHNAIAFIGPAKQHTDTFIFATSDAGSQIYDFYFNNMDLLERFKYYFYEKADALIHEHQKQPFKFTHRPNKILHEEFNHAFREKGTKQGLSVDNYFIHASRCCKLTHREVSCLYWLSIGKSSEEIGIILGISKRTVDSHLCKAKKKLNCMKMTSLVSKAIEKNLF